MADVLFWGILGVFVGGRLGWVLFYGLPSGAIHSFWQVFKVWEGGMSFHGGLLGVIVAYLIYVPREASPARRRSSTAWRLATPLGIFSVRMANFINAELYGRAWDGPWAMRFPRYDDNSAAPTRGRRATTRATPKPVCGRPCATPASSTRPWARASCSSSSCAG